MPPESSPDETIFAAALQWETEASRSAYLEEACAGDPGLRRRVEELLKASEAARTFLENPLARRVDGAAPNAGARAVVDQPEAAGTRIGRYKLLQQIGEGGCGTVFMAEQEVPVRRRVALKVIKLGMDTKSVVARFEAERQALALMDHPNIARVLDAGATASGRPYFVMELVRGIRITDYCEQNQLGTRQRLDLFIQVCQAIQHAHQKGIIHRDIKPSNILVTLHDGVPVPKVIDFGIAKATEGRLTDATLFTAFEQFIGTPAYMSPEQAEMSGLDVDTRSDIYSLGVLLYELLAGGTPFDAKELMSLGLDTMRKTIREKEPQRPSTRLTQALTLVVQPSGGSGPAKAGTTSQDAASIQRLRRVIAAVQGDLDWIVMKCLEKDRTRRYETANGLANDILRHLSSEPVLARPPSAAYRFRKAFQRNRVIFAAGGLVVIALSLGIACSLWQAVRARQAARRAREAESVAGRRLAESEAISRFMAEVFQSPDPAKDGRSITVAETLGAAARKLDSDLLEQPDRRAALQSTLGKTYFALGLYHEAVDILTKAREIRLARLGADHPDTLDTAHWLAVSLRRGGRISDALKEFGPLLESSRRTWGVRHENTLRSEAEQLYSIASSGRPKAALERWSQLLPQAEIALGSNHPVTLRLRADYGYYSCNEGNLDLGVPLLEQVAAERQRTLGSNHADTLIVLGSLSYFYEDIGRIELAKAVRQRVLEGSRRRLGEDHADTLRALSELGSLYARTGRYEEGLAMVRDALKRNRATLGMVHPRVVGTLFDLRNVLAIGGRHREALEVAEELDRLAERPLGQSPDRGSAIGALAQCYVNVGRLKEAGERVAQAVQISESSGGAVHPMTVQLKCLQMTIWTLQGRPQESLLLIDRTLPELIRVLGTNQIQVDQMVFERARARDRSEGVSAAAADYDASLPSILRRLSVDDAERLPWERAYARFLIRMNRLDQAERVLGTYSANLKRLQPAPGDLEVLAVAQAWLSEARGDGSGALKRMEAAVPALFALRDQIPWPDRLWLAEGFESLDRLWAQLGRSEKHAHLLSLRETFLAEPPQSTQPSHDAKP